MGRYLRVIGYFWSAALAAEMEYRTNFLIATLSSLGSLAGNLLVLFLFYRGGYSFQVWEPTKEAWRWLEVCSLERTWRWEEVLIVLGIFTLLQGFSSTFLVPNLNRIVRHVQQGTLDFVLLKPIGSQFWLSARTISPWGIPDLGVGCSLIVYAGSRLNLGMEQYLAGLAPLLCGIVSLYSLWFMLSATSIWFVKIYNVTEVLRGLLEAGRFPMVAYPFAYRFFFTFIIPVAFLTTVPACIMLNRSTSNWAVGSGLLALGLLLASHLFWRFALRFYTSASS